MINKKLFKFPKTENYLIAVLTILSLNIFVNYLSVDIKYYFTSDQIDTIFYINDHVPKNDTILVPDLSDQNYIYDLLIGYKLVLIDNSAKDPRVYDTIRGYLGSMNKSYVIIDISIMERRQVERFMNNNRFKILYENNQNIFFKYRL